MPTVMRYIKSSQQGRGPLIAVQADLPKMVVTREAAMPVEYGVKGRELMRMLRDGCMKFIKAMELQGLTLIPLPEGNPMCVTNLDDSPRPTFSMTKDLDRVAPDEYVDAKTGGKGPPTLKVPTSLDMSDGYVDYRFVGVFWAPQVSVEIATTREAIHSREQASKNPQTWGAGKSTPNI